MGPVNCAANLKHFLLRRLRNLDFDFPSVITFNRGVGIIIGLQINPSRLGRCDVFPSTTNKY